jgi:hypothetical protein
LHLNVHVPYLHVLVGTRNECLRDACSCPGRVGGGGSESSESSDEEYICKDASAFAPLFLINIRSDRALLLWCFGAFSRRFLNLRTQKQEPAFFVARSYFFKNVNRPFFENVLRNKNVPPTVFRMPASYERGTPVGIGLL